MQVGQPFGLNSKVLMKLFIIICKGFICKMIPLIGILSIESLKNPSEDLKPESCLHGDVHVL